MPFQPEAALPPAASRFLRNEPTVPGWHTEWREALRVSSAPPETTLEQVRTIIGEREGRGDWTFAYLGAAPDRWAAETGMSAGSSAALCLAEPRASFAVASEATRRLRASSRASTRTFFDGDERS